VFVQLKRLQVSGIVRHPDYTWPALGSDLAVLTLGRPVRWSGWVRPACLAPPDSPDWAGERGVIAGWG